MTTTKPPPVIEEQEPAQPAPAEAPSETRGWTPAHRLALGVLLALLLFLLLIQYARRPYRLDSAVTLVPGHAAALSLMTDPNTADEATLARVPHVGEKMARAIVSYRELHHDAQGIAFQNLGDLDAVTGIGKKTLEELRPYLQFPGDATQPARSPKGLTPPQRLDNPPEN